jgi:rhodanese-related sulfurtransferase
LQVLKREDRVTATEFRDAIQSLSSKTSATSITRPYLLIDVRPHLETTICRLPESVSVPYESLEQRAEELKELVSQHLPRKDTEQSLLPG